MYPIAAGLEKIKVKLLRESDPLQAPLLAWPLVCGAKIAGKTEAVSFENGKLTVLVPAHEWKLELASLAADYRAKLNELLPKSVHHIVFITTEEFGKKHS